MVENKIEQTKIIAVDCGFESLRRIGIKPDFFVGDMDSSDPKCLKNDDFACQSFPFEVDKDETDTELAIRCCLELGLKDIVILNSLTGRFDHCLGVIANLQLANKLGLNAVIDTGVEKLFLPSKDFVAKTGSGKIISLIPLSNEVAEVTTTGLKYPLKKESLYKEKTRGISNITVSDEFSVCFKAGELLVIITEGNEESSGK